MKKLIATGLVASVITVCFAQQFSFAANLQTYNLKSDGDLKEVGATLKKLGTKIALPSDLTSNASLANMNQTSRITSANSIKQFLNKSGPALDFDQNVQKPTTFNPQWDASMTRAIKEERFAAVCRGVINKFPISDVLETLQKHTPSQTFTPDARQAKQLSELNRIIGSLPGDLGSVQHFDVVNGVISELHASKASANFTDSNTVSISIPFLVNMKTGKDSNYLDALACLNDYFSKQNDILQIRDREISDSDFATKIQAREQTFKDIYQTYKSSLADNQTPQDFKSFRHARLLESSCDSIDLYLLEKDSYLLKSADLKGAIEVEANEARLAILSKAMPVAAARLKDSKFAHDQLAKLSPAQLDLLLKLMIELRGNDVPTANQVSALKHIAVEGKNESVTADYIQYSVLLQALTELEMSLNQ